MFYGEGALQKFFKVRREANTCTSGLQLPPIPIRLDLSSGLPLNNCVSAALQRRVTFRRAFQKSGGEWYRVVAPLHEGLWDLVSLYREPGGFSWWENY